MKRFGTWKKGVWQSGIWQKAIALLLTLALLAPGLAFAMDGAVYEIFVASYFDSNGDGMGDLAGVAAKLPYIHGLGARNLWLMPIAPSPSYHKYDVTDYCAIDPAYGDMADFDALAKACEALGMGLLLDMVFNHTSVQHPWFQGAAQSLTVAPCGQAECAEGLLCREHNPLCRYYYFTEGQGQHPVPGADGWFYEGFFGAHMPDLALEEPLVREELRSVMLFWLERGATGFRLDAVSHYFEQSEKRNVEVLKWLKDTACAAYPDCVFVAEAWTDQASILGLYGSGIDSFFDFPLSGQKGSLATALRNGDGAGLAQKAADWQGRIGEKNAAAVNAPFLTNHDMGRMAGVLVSRLPQMKLAASIYLLMGGNPYIYYGEELGMTGSGADENKRLPMLWSTDSIQGMCLPPKGADQAQRLQQGADVQEQDKASLLWHYRNVLAIRNQFPEMSHLRPEAVDTGSKAVMGLRFAGEEGVVAVYHNLGQEEVSVEVDASALLAGTLDAGEGAARLEEGRLILPPFASGVLQ